METLSASMSAHWDVEIFMLAFSISMVAFSISMLTLPYGHLSHDKQRGIDADGNELNGGTHSVIYIQYAAGQ